MATSSSVKSLFPLWLTTSKTPIFSPLKMMGTAAMDWVSTPVIESMFLKCFLSRLAARMISGLPDEKTLPAMLPSIGTSSDFITFHWRRGAATKRRVVPDSSATRMDEASASVSSEAASATKLEVGLQIERVAQVAGGFEQVFESERAVLGRHIPPEGGILSNPIRFCQIKKFKSNQASRCSKIIA